VQGTREGVVENQKIGDVDRRNHLLVGRVIVAIGRATS
jgi:hypothetical protein